MRHTHFTFISSLISCAILLTSCSLFSPVKTENEKTYTLSSLPDTIPTQSKRNITLLVLHPETNPINNSTQMAYTCKPYQTSYFSKNRWVATPADMLQPLMVETLQKTQHYRSVITPPTLTHSDFALNTQLLELQQDFLHHPSVIHFRIRTELTHVSDNNIIASKEFDINVSTSENTPYGGVVAANKATALFLNELARFCNTHTQ